MLIAGASAVFGWVNLDRARAADAETQKRALAESARGDAEKLVGFLIEDFYAELEPTGRLETMGKLAHMAVSYYDGLPRGTDDAADADLPRHGADPRRRGPERQRRPRDAGYRKFDEAQSGVREAARGRRPRRSRSPTAWRWR